MTKSTGIGWGGSRPGTGRPKGSKNTVYKEGETVTFSLSYNKKDTAHLKRAWKLVTQYDKEPVIEFKEWLKAISKNGPLEYASRMIGIYDEDDETAPIADQD